MKMQRKKLIAAVGEDRISDLPDEILFNILRRLTSPSQTARTSVLSRGWRSLWLSYPVVQYHSGDRFSWSGTATDRKMIADMHKFGIAAIRKFSRNEVLQMETLKVCLAVPKGNVRFPVIEQLLDLASKRKSKEVKIVVGVFSREESHIVLPFRLLSNPTAKSFHFSGIAFALDGARLSLNSLRLLHLEIVKFENDQFLTELIASAPLLETVELKFVKKMSKLQVFNAPKLKRLQFFYCDTLEEIEITAPRLLSLDISLTDNVFKIGLIAPQLEVLRIGSSKLHLGDISALISKLGCMKTFALTELYHFENKVKLSCPGLEEFELSAPDELQEIELDAGPRMKKFLLHYDVWPDQLKKCEIRNAAAVCHWEVGFRTMIYSKYEETHEWFVQFRNFMARFSQFRTVRIHCCNDKVTFKEEEVDNTLQPLPIKHLKISIGLLSNIDQKVLLDGLFWVCRPRFVTVIHSAIGRRERLFPVFLSQCSCKPSTNGNGDGCNERRSWPHELKDVKIVTRDVDKTVEGEEIEEGELIDISGNAVGSIKDPDLVSFMLTWY